MRRRAAIVVAIWAGLTALIWAYDMAAGVGFADDTWFLQLLDRVHSGDGLYSDITYPLPPLGVWVSLPFTWAFGTEIAVTKAVISAITAASALVAARIAMQLGLSRSAQVMVALTPLAFATLPTPSPYNPLAYLTLLGLLSATLEWQRRTTQSARGAERRALIAAGVLAGFTLTSKYTTGLLGIAAFAASVLLFSPGGRPDLRHRLEAVAIAAGVAAGVSLVVLLPVLLDGSISGLLDNMLHSGEYVRRGSVSYLEGFDELGQLLSYPWGSPEAILRQTIFVLLPIAAIGLAAAARRERDTAGTLGAFLTAAVAAPFPRADVYHVALAAPFAAIALVWSASKLTGRHRAERLRAAVAIVCAVLAGVTLIGFARALRTGGHRADLRHLRGAYVPATVEDGIAATGSAVAAADGGEDRTMVLAPGAGAVYLVSGISDPTAFDYPLSFEIYDATPVMAAIESGRIRRVCIGGYVAGFETLAPTELIDYVRRRMTAVEAPAAAVPVTTSCTLYAREGGG